MTSSGDSRVPKTGGLSYLVAGLLAGALAAAGVAFLVWPEVAAGPGDSGGRGGGPPGGFGPAPVDVVAAVEIVAAEPVQLLGTVAAVRESLVASEVDGLAVKVMVDEGDAVRAGDVLVQLRTTTIEQRLVGARAAREESIARLANAEADFDRLELLRQREAISRREYDLATANRDALLQAVTRLEAEALQLEDILERATVRAPFSGLVSALHVELGEWVDRGDEIVTLVDLSEVEVTVQIAERYISAVPVGFTVGVRFDALPGRQYAGRVKAIVPQALPESRTFPVLVQVANPNMAIKGGMAARVVAQLGSPVPAVLVAKDALVRRGNQVFVYRVQPSDSPGVSGEGTEGAIEELLVQTGPARGQWQVVYGAVGDGDLIVVRGNERVRPGQPVVVAAVRDLPVPEADPDRPIAIDPRQSPRP